jgi:DNA repair protein RadD
VIELYDYQRDLVNSARDIAKFLPKPVRVLIQLETGGGKTVLILEPIRLAHEKGKKVLWVCRGRELVKQADEHLWSWGLPHGIIMAGEETSPAGIQLCSKDTLLSWCKRRQNMGLPRADLLIIDEAHETAGPQYRWLLEQYHDAFVIGLTATPVEAKGNPLLGNFWGGMAQGIKTSELIRRGYLVPSRVFSHYIPDLRGVPTSNGDWQQKQLAERMDKTKLVGDIVTHWLEMGEQRRTIAYATNIAHAMHICEDFVKHGVPCEHVDGSTDNDTREAILKRLASGETLIVTSVGVLIQGVDIPAASCMIDAAPTKSFGRQRQKWGRLKRLFPGKKYALILDHAGNAVRHGHPDMDIDWQLNKGEKIQDKVARQLKQKPAIVCPACHAIFSGLRECPNCGKVMKTQAKDVSAKNGKLVEFNGSGDAVQVAENMKRFWLKCLAIAAHKGRSAKAALGMFKSNTGKLPWEVPGLSPLPDSSQWGASVAELFPQFIRRKQ